MAILIPDIIDTALVSGIISLFVIADILAKNRLKIDFRDTGADLAIGALVIQLSFVIVLLKGQQMTFFWNNIVLAICFAILWICCLWLAGKKDPLYNMFSYTIGTLMLSASIMHFLGTFRLIGIALLALYSLILSVLAFIVADYLQKGNLKYDYKKLTEKLEIYDINESYRKLEAGKRNTDPLQPVIDIIRGAIRNKDTVVAVTGIEQIADLCRQALLSGGNTALVIKHLNVHLYHLAVLAGEERDRFTLVEIIDVLGSVGKQCAQANSEKLVLLNTDTLSNFFESYRESGHFPKPDKLSRIKHSKDIRELVSILQGKEVSTPMHELAIVTGEAGIIAAEKNMLEPTEKAVLLLKNIALDAASNADAATMEYVRVALLDFAHYINNKEHDHLKKLIIYALRDIGIKTVQESPSLKKHDCLDKVVEALQEIGEIFGTDSITDVASALKDIGVIAARKHSDEKVSRIIPVLEHLCTVAADNRQEEQESSAINAMREVCEISMKEQMVESTASSSKSLANLSNIEELSLFVNEAVFEIGRYREEDREMFALFEKTYVKSGGR